MLKNIRRKVANAVSPDTKEYSFIEVNWATPESENRKSLQRAHKTFEKVHGRKAYSDAEAWKYDRECLNEHLRELGLKEVSTEFEPSHFIEKEQTASEKAIHSDQ